MKAKLIIEGREFPIEIQDPELQKLLEPKKTGYERVEINSEYYLINEDYIISGHSEQGSITDYVRYDSGNYYSNLIVAENNARADRLIRQLRRFAVEHRKKNPTWERNISDNACIYYDHEKEHLNFSWDDALQFFGCIYFDSEETAKEAIKTFHDELIWYFTEYKDSL